MSPPVRERCTSIYFLLAQAKCRLLPLGCLLLSWELGLLSRPCWTLAWLSTGTACISPKVFRTIFFTGFTAHTFTSLQSHTMFHVHSATRFETEIPRPNSSTSRTQSCPKCSLRHRMDMHPPTVILCYIMCFVILHRFGMRS